MNSDKSTLPSLVTEQTQQQEVEPTQVLPVSGMAGGSEDGQLSSINMHGLPKKAQQLLDLCSLIGNCSIPEEFLRTYTTTYLGEDTKTPIEADKSITALRECGLLHIESLENKTWFLHQATHTHAWSAYYGRLSSVLDKSRLNANEPFIRLLEMLQEPPYQGNASTHLVAQGRIYSHAVIFLSERVGAITSFLELVRLRKLRAYDLYALLAPAFSAGGLMAIRLGESETGIMFSHSALKLFESHYSPKHELVAVMLTRLGVAYGNVGNLGKKLELLQRAYDMTVDRCGAEHIDMTDILTNLASAHSDSGNVNQGQALLRQALAIEERHYGRTHPIVAQTLYSLGAGCNALGNGIGAQVLLERALSILEKHDDYGPDHPEVANILTNLGNAYVTLNHPKQIQVLERAVAIGERHYGPMHPRVANFLTNLANALTRNGDLLQQRALFERALAIFKHHYGSDHANTAKALTNLGVNYGISKEPETGVTLLLQALPITRRHYGTSHPEVAFILLSLSDAYVDLGNTREALRLGEQALELFQKAYSKNHRPHPLLSRAEKNVTIGRDIVDGTQAYVDELIKYVVAEHSCTRVNEAVRQLLYRVYADARVLRVNAEGFTASWRSHTLSILERQGDARTYCDGLADLLVSFGHPLLATSYRNLAMEVGASSAKTASSSQMPEVAVSSTSQPSSMPAQSSSSSGAQPLFFGIFNQEESSEKIALEKLLSFYKTDDKDKALRNAAVNGRLKDATLLLQWGANINAQDNNPTSLRTALHHAAIKGNKEMMTVLMEHHADNTILDAQGKRAQDYLPMSPRP